MQKLRLKNRRIRKRRKSVNEWIILLIIFFIFVIGMEFYEFIERGFPLRNFRIKCSNLNPEDMKSLVGLNPGENLLRIRLEEIFSKLTKDSRIKNVCVYRNFSDGLVEIEVKERTPFVKILISGTNKCFEVDVEGVIIGERDNIYSSVPMVTGLSINPQVRSPDINEMKILKKAIEVLKMTNFCNIPMEEISEINMNAPDDIILFTTNGTEIHLGSENLNISVKRAGIIFNELKRKGISAKYVDLRFGEEAVVKMD